MSAWESNGVKARLGEEEFQSGTGVGNPGEILAVQAVCTFLASSDESPENGA